MKSQSLILMETDDKGRKTGKLKGAKRYREAERVPPGNHPELEQMSPPYVPGGQSQCLRKDSRFLP